MKKLFVLVSDGGDGSYSPRYTFNDEWIAKRDADHADLEHGDVGVDGDGFHYDTLNVSDECTLESLGGFSDCALDELETAD